MGSPVFEQTVVGEGGSYRERFRPAAEAYAHSGEVI